MHRQSLKPHGQAAARNNGVAGIHIHLGIHLASDPHQHTIPVDSERHSRGHQHGDGSAGGVHEAARETVGEHVRHLIVAHGEQLAPAAFPGKGIETLGGQPPDAPGGVVEPQQPPRESREHGLRRCRHGVG